MNEKAAAARCWICSQPTAAVEYHTTAKNVFDRAACTKQEDKEHGKPLCPSCHTAVHAWMRSHGREAADPAQDAVEALFTRLIGALLPRDTDLEEG